MAECTGNDLQISRTRAKLVQWQIGNACNVSESEIGRWERDEALPEPDDVDRFAAACGDPTLWHRWMLSHYDSYRRRYINGSAEYNLPVLMARMRFELGDVLGLQDRVERDALDGKIDDRALKTQFIKELKEAIAALTDGLQELLKDEKGANNT